MLILLNGSILEKLSDFPWVIEYGAKDTVRVRVRVRVRL